MNCKLKMQTVNDKNRHIYSSGSGNNGSRSSPPQARTSATKGNRRKKRGRPRSKAWSRKSEFIRRHQPKYLRWTEVNNLIQADQFATRIGQPLRAFVSIRWSLTQHGETDIQKRWASLWNAIRIWASRHGIIYVAISVHENPKRAEPAFNTHMFINIVPNLIEEFASWLRGRIGGTSNAVDVRLRQSVQWGIDRTLPYVLKGSDPQTARAFGIRYNNQGIVPFKRCGTTRNINAQAREAWKISGTLKLDAGRSQRSTRARTTCHARTGA